MYSINFRAFRAYTDIAHRDTITSDVSFTVADLIYKNSNGVLAADLAMRIYKSEEPVTVNEDELAFLKNFIKGLTPIFQDSFELNVVNTEEKPK